MAHKRWQSHVINISHCAARIKSWPCLHEIPGSWMEKKNFLFVSLTGLISDIAWQVSKEGHEVRYFIGDKKERDIGDGFVAKSKDWEKDVDWADILIFDDTLGQGEKAQALRQQGKKVIDVNCIVNNHGIYPLEFTSRFGYPTISIQQAGCLRLSGNSFWT